MDPLGSLSVLCLLSIVEAITCKGVYRFFLMQCILKKSKIVSKGVC